MYPLVVIENSIANENSFKSLFSSTGRISYTSGNFLRFFEPKFIKDPQLMTSKDRLQQTLKTFSREMQNVYDENFESFKWNTKEILDCKGFIFEEDLFKENFKCFDIATETEKRFAVHKFLFEGIGWIKDSQWRVSSQGTGAGPYILRPLWQINLLKNTKKALDSMDLESFRLKVKNCKGKFICENGSEELILECLKVFADDFYANVIGVINPFKSIVSEAFLGISILDTQAQARNLLRKLCGQLNPLEIISKPLINSFIGKDLIFKAKEKTIVNVEENNEFLYNTNTSTNTKPFNQSTNVHDFGNLEVWLIDPIGTIEVDDGISVEEIFGKNEAIVHVHVADPSEYVIGDIEIKAKSKAESLYFPEFKIPMLPKNITEISTLKSSSTSSPVKTLTFSCRIDLSNGEIYDHKIRQGIIKNLKHVTYEEAENINNNKTINLMKKISDAHLKYRESRGHLNFSFPKGFARLDRENCKIIVEHTTTTYKNVIKSAVAEMMIIAGRISGEFMEEHNLLGPFRYHPGVNLQKIVDQEIKSKLIESNISVLSLYEKYEIVKTLPSGAIDSRARKHNSMGLEAYIKVTSPLRRYLDLVTHKILKTELCANNKYSEYGNEWFMHNLVMIHRKELYNKRLSSSVNRFWIEKYLWQQQELTTNSLSSWTLIPLEKVKEGIWTVFIEEVATIFVVKISDEGIELGHAIKGRMIGKQSDSLLSFDRVINQL